MLASLIDKPIMFLYREERQEMQTIIILITLVAPIIMTGVYKYELIRIEDKLFPNAKYFR